ncbi:class I tRNA ligase family protein [Candidatus Woesearchaeota archaeon]|nr:class I tRNA ligase family protein [Candidatus Woesearchaeota archaeon]
MAYTVFLEALKMLAPIAPFITEKMYQELKKKFDLQEESIHHHDWPTHDQELINEELEKEFEVAKSSIQAILSVREKIKQGTRWPLQEAIIAATGLETPEVIDAVKRQANVKEIKVVHKYEGAKTSVKADYDKLLPEFGSQKATRIIAALAMTAPETVLKYIERDGEFSLSIENEKVVLAQKHFTITKQAPHGYEWAEFDKGEVYVSIMTSPELEAEGYARELTRKMQNMRKLAGLNKQQRISAHINATEALVSALQSHAESIREKVGAEKLHLSTQPSVHTYTHSSKEKIRDKELWIGIDVV